MGDEHAEDFGIGLRFKDMPLGFEERTDGRVVLDDPVVDQGYAVVSVAVWVCVELVHRSVGCPTGVGESEGALDSTDGFELGFEVRDASDGFGDLESVAVDRGDARGVVAAVFESFEPFEEEGLSGFVSDVGDDAAHRRFSCEGLDGCLWIREHRPKQRRVCMVRAKEG